MCNLTVPKSYRAPKPVGSPSMVSKLRLHLVSSKKYVGKVIRIQNEQSTTNRIGDEVDDVSEEEAYAKPVKDVSMETYMLQKLVMLEGDSIIADIQNR